MLNLRDDKMTKFRKGQRAHFKRNDLWQNYRLSN